MEKSKRVVGYARVSTEAQDITRQIELITAYCSDRNYHLIKIIQEKISGARKYGHEIEMYTVEQGEKRDKRQ